MKLLISYGLAGLIFFTADTAADPCGRLQEQLSGLDFGHFRPADPLGTTRHTMAEHHFQSVPERVRFRQNAAYRAEPLDRSGVLSSENGQSRAEDHVTLPMSPATP